MLSLAIRRASRRMAVFSYACWRFNSDGACLGALERHTRSAEDYSRPTLCGIALKILAHRFVRLEYADPAMLGTPTMRYIGAVQLQRDVRQIQFVHKLATNEIRPPMRAAVIIDFIGRGERIRTSDLSVPNRAHYQAVLRPEGRHSNTGSRDLHVVPCGR
jgi:hypothetical protein